MKLTWRGDKRVASHSGERQIVAKFPTETTVSFVVSVSWCSVACHRERSHPGDWPFAALWQEWHTAAWKACQDEADWLCGDIHQWSGGRAWLLAWSSDGASADDEVVVTQSVKVTFTITEPRPPFSWYLANTTTDCFTCYKSSQSCYKGLSVRLLSVSMISWV